MHRFIWGVLKCLKQKRGHIKCARVTSLPAPWAVPTGDSPPHPPPTWLHTPLPCSRCIPVMRPGPRGAERGSPQLLLGPHRPLPPSCRPPPLPPILLQAGTWTDAVSPLRSGCLQPQVHVQAHVGPWKQQEGGTRILMKREPPCRPWAAHPGRPADSTALRVQATQSPV